jgi:hypothetical protein
MVNIVPIVERSKAVVCKRSLVSTAASNPAGGMDACFLSVLDMLSGRGLGVGLIRAVLPSLSECDREASTLRTVAH